MSPVRTAAMRMRMVEYDMPVSVGDDDVGGVTWRGSLLHEESGGVDPDSTEGVGADGRMT